MRSKKLVALYGSLLLFLLCAAGFGAKMGIVRAEESYEQVYREANGGLEELVGIFIPDEEIGTVYGEGELENYDYANLNPSASEFLEWGSSYGYQDLAKRSHGTARQYLYRKMLENSKTFSLNRIDAQPVTTSNGNTFFSVVNIPLTGEYLLTEDEKLETYYTFRNDNPQFFWLSNTVVWSQSSLTVLTYDDYKTGSVREAVFNEILQTAEDVYQAGLPYSGNAYEKTLYIHDALIADIEYAEDVDTPITHSIAGAMTARRSAVCEGYAKVMQLMMNSCNVANIYVTGLGNGGGHAWNMAEMDDGQYYWLDATWDDQAYEEFTHNYFLVGERNFTDHVPDMPDGIGTEFLYELPSVPLDDYMGAGQGPLEPDDYRDNLTASLHTLDGQTVSTTAEGKPKVLIFFQPGCYNCQTMLALFQDQWLNFSGIDIIAAEGTGKTLEEVKSFYETYGTDHVTYCYGAQNTMWNYAGRVGLSGSLTTPLVVYIDEQNRIVGHSTGMDRRLIHTIYVHLGVDMMDWSGEDAPFLRGDVNEDRSVDIQDLRQVLRYVCGKTQLNERQIQIADVEKNDGKVDIQDLRKILRFVCKKITEL